VNGRTLYFDWLDYTGGMFEGRRIRCQVISVPGQASLAPRRRRLLEEADAIVFVGDSTPTGFEADRDYLVRLSQALDTLPGPPVGVIMQANKRDHAEAVPMDRIHALLDSVGMHMGITESVAINGDGIRETFVFAVRLALDRVRELMNTGALATARPQINNADELLADLKRAEGDADLNLTSETRMPPIPFDARPDNVIAEVVAQVIEENTAVTPQPSFVRADGDQAPRLPDETVASGLVWPPVDGRLVLHELARAQVRISRNPRGDWCGVANDRWRLLSPADAVFDDLDQGRAVLVNAARANADREHSRVLVRCVVLAADGDGRHRLWTVSRLTHLGDSTTQDAAAATG